MNIAIFTDTYLPQINGVVFSTTTFAHAFEMQGHTVLIVTPKIGSDSESTEKIWRFSSMPFPFQPEYRMTSPVSRKLRKFAEKNIDIIHIQTPFFMGHLGQYLGWRHNIPIVHTYHTFWAEYLHYFPLLPKKLRQKADMLLLSRNFCNRCQHIVVPSIQIQETLEIYGVTKPISVIPTGIEKRTVSQEAIRHFKDKWQLPTQDKICIFVGRLGKEKNVFFLLESFAAIAKKHPNTTLLIVGDGPERDALASYSQELGIAKKIIFTGYLSHDDVFNAYAASDVILFPSKTETQGLSLLEGMSLGKPAVGLNALGVKQLLEGERGGFLTEERLSDYVDAASLLLSDSEIYTQKSAGAIQRSEDFSSTHMAQKLLTVYTELKNNTKKTDPPAL